MPRQAFKDIAQRLVNAEENFIASLMEFGAITRAEAIRVFDLYRREKIIKRDTAIGRYHVTHGAFLDREAIRNALALSKNPSTPIGHTRRPRPRGPGWPHPIPPFHNADYAPGDPTGRPGVTTGVYHGVHYAIGPRTPFPGIGWWILHYTPAGKLVHSRESQGAFYDDPDDRHHPGTSYQQATRAVKQWIDKNP
jgi:hypothetical protein